VTAWRRAVVEPLRAVRRALKGMDVMTAPALRKEVQRLELRRARGAAACSSRRCALVVAASEAAAAADNLAC